jgi:hypothetical protein
MLTKSWDGYIRHDDESLAALQRHGVEAHRIEAMRRTRDEYDATHDRRHVCDCLCPWPCAGTAGDTPKS